MTNFDFLLKDARFSEVADVAISAERLLCDNMLHNCQHQLSEYTL